MALLASSLALACAEPNALLNPCDNGLIEPANDGECGDPDGLIEPTHDEDPGDPDGLIEPTHDDECDDPDNGDASNTACTIATCDNGLIEPTHDEDPVDPDDGDAAGLIPPKVPL